MFCELGNKKAICSRSQWIKHKVFGIRPLLQGQHSEPSMSNNSAYPTKKKKQPVLPEEQSNHWFSPHPKPDAQKLSIPSFQTSGYV
ncbi:hypothetical protein Hanom_Chr12g01074691 [Helianthus anomalus]